MSAPTTTATTAAARVPLLLASLVGLTSIACDVAGEKLKSNFVARRRRAWRTANAFHLTHAAGLACVAFMLARPEAYTEAGRRRLAKGYYLVLTGAVGFAASIYVVCFDSVPRMLGVLTPTSGFVLMLGWLWAGLAEGSGK